MTGYVRRTVENGIHHSSVQTAAKHNTLEQEHPHWPCQHHHQKLTQITLLELGRRISVLLALLSHLIRFGLEHYRCICLRHRQQDRPCRTSDDKLKPVSPSPGHHGDEPRSYRPDKRPPCGRAHEQRHGPTTSLRRAPNVGVNASNDRDGRRRAYTSEQPHDNEACPRRCKSTAQGKCSVDSECRYHVDLAAVGLRKRREEDRS